MGFIGKNSYGVDDWRNMNRHGYCYCMRCGYAHQNESPCLYPHGSFKVYSLAPIKREGKKIDYRGVFDDERR